MQDLVVSFQSGRWEPVADVERSFVHYRNNEPSPGAVWQYAPGKGDVNLSVVIPTSDAYRGGYFLKLLSQIDSKDEKQAILATVLDGFSDGAFQVSTRVWHETML